MASQVKIIAKDDYHPNIWHNQFIGQSFELIKAHNDLIPKRYEVKYNHPSGICLILLC
jgi:hypothetical protein